MDWLRMPPLAALRAFAAFAETGNVAAAGRALNVSHAAISQQLRALEGHLGAVLLDRSGRGLALNAEGQHLARALELGFGAIGAAVEELSRDSAARPLQVTLTPTFAVHWLMPRLASFRAAHPEIDLVLDPRGDLADPAPGGVDVAIRFGKGDWPGLAAELLLPAPMSVVAAPGLLDGRSVTCPEDLLGLPWLEELGTTEASKWLREHGVDGRVRTRLTLPGNLLLDAVREGQGVAVAVRPFIEADLTAGRLAELFTSDGGRGYHIVTRPGVLRPPAKAFAAWLKRQRSA